MVRGKAWFRVSTRSRSQIQSGELGCQRLAPTDVLLEGIFSARKKGHMSAFSGSINALQIDGVVIASESVKSRSVAEIFPTDKNSKSTAKRMRFMAAIIGECHQVAAATCPSVFSGPIGEGALVKRYSSCMIGRRTVDLNAPDNFCENLL